MVKKIKVGIVGGSGYTGGELLRILYGHPFVEIVGVTSRKYSAGSESGWQSAIVVRLAV